MTRLLIAAILLWSVPTPGSAQPMGEVFETGNRAYFAGDFQQALESYARLSEAGVEDADLSFNLATVHARLGNYGEAIRYFERTLRQRPGDDGAEQGLTAVRTALGRRLAEARGEALVQTRPPFGEALVRPFSQDLLAWLVLAFDVLLFGVLIVRRRLLGETGRLALGIAAPLLGVLLVLAAGGLAIKSGVLIDGHAAIVVARDATTMREGPDPRASARGEAAEGEHARVVDQQGDWVLVRLYGGREGWLPADDVGVI